MQFLSRAQVITAFAAVGLAVFVLDLVRRRKLSEEYSLLWVLSSLGMAVLGFSTPLLQGITRLLGMQYPSSTVFAFGVAFGVAMLLYMSIRMSRLGREHQAMARELALLGHELGLKHAPPAADARTRGNG